MTGFYGKSEIYNEPLNYKKCAPRTRGRVLRAKRKANASALRETLVKPGNRKKVSVV